MTFVSFPAAVSAEGGGIQKLLDVEKKLADDDTSAASGANFFGNAAEECECDKCVPNKAEARLTQELTAAALLQEEPLSPEQIAEIAAKLDVKVPASFANATFPPTPRDDANPTPHTPPQK